MPSTIAVMKIHSPMKTLSRNLTASLALAVLAVSLTGCRVLDYRAVQRDFNLAVQADNAEQPFTEPHAQIVATLTTNYIAKLDPKLRPNAWMLRAVSAWRSGQLELARTSAEQGLHESALQAHSRDAVILKLVPGLGVDSELLGKWRVASNHLSAAQYAPFASDFRTAWDQLQSAQAEVGPPTPESVISYVHFQKWRVLEDWRIVLSGLTDDTTRQSARDEAKQVLGKDLKEAADAERNAIPAGHPLREYIRARGGG